MEQNTGTLPKKSFLAAFRDHPASVGETYLQHMGFACHFSFQLFCAGIAAAVHAFVPPLFESTASRIICQLHGRISSRNTSK